MTIEADNLDVVRRYRAAFATYEPSAYEDMFIADPLSYGGFTMRRGIDAVHATAASARILYPHGALGVCERRAVADGNWVAQLIERQAITNRDVFYDNVYIFFYEVLDGKIATQVEMLDFRVSDAAFDLGQLSSVAFPPGERRAPVQVAELPAADEVSPIATAKRTALAFWDALLTFDPDRFLPLLIDEPMHQVGMTKRHGRSGFIDIARIGRVLYPDGIAGRTIHALVSDGQTVAMLLTVRARTNKGVEYENLYAVIVDVHEGKVAAQIEILDGRVAAEAFDVSMLATSG